VKSIQVKLVCFLGVVILMGAGSVIAQDPPTCPPDSMFSQAPHLPADPWNVEVNELGWSPRLVDNFSGLTDSICDVHWWGFEVESQPERISCVKQVPFEIIFFADDMGWPGAVVAQRVVTPQRTNTGLDYEGEELVYYEVDFADGECVDLAAGWITILAGDDPQNPDCLFYWVTSPDGDGISVYDYGEGTEPGILDWAFCLTPPDATPTPTPTMIRLLPPRQLRP